MGKKQPRKESKMSRNKGEYREYKECHKDAQADADEFKRDYGIEKNSLFGYYRYFMLPNPENRYGYELKCEVVSPMLINRGN